MNLEAIRRRVMQLEQIFDLLRDDQWLSGSTMLDDTRQELKLWEQKLQAAEAAQLQEARRA